MTKQKNEVRSLDEIKLEIAFYESERNQIDHDIKILIKEIESLPLNQRYKNKYSKLVRLGNSHRKTSDIIVKLNEELSATKLYLSKVKTTLWA